MCKNIDMIIKENSCCIISKSFKNKLEEINNKEILIGEIIEDDNNKLCVIEILSDDELLERYEEYDNKICIVKVSDDTDDEFDIILPKNNYQDIIINANPNFHPVIHEPKSLKVRGDK